ncbi:NADH dehydrogenase [ubiquinone] flavoprotein 3, mitochondrial isoform X1 [Carlito syrichta]|uniref:NADH dehydrogenase [ubiquinone] flavoprotein 3, mitochondrial isoform X1 n=1 Tax=Carlito syrichta TaxID=1868482 RepID=A0A1U7USP6_CARSF|nr:NADH dehydrogenase [ubiquinone] flavoprotein 3, mitochondrial isoform X1 [Carlito syrichta]
MAAPVLLRQGRAGPLKTILLEAQVFRGLASTVSLSAESGKSDKGGLPPNSKKQSSPKNIVEPKERGRLPATQAAAELSRNVSSPRSYPSVANKGGIVASPNPDDSVLFTDKGVLKLVSRKTLVEFPQKVSSPFRKQGSGSEACREGQRAMNDSSSSSSSSSDSESDDEGHISEAGPQVVSKGKGKYRKPEAAHSLENRGPQDVISVKEKTLSQKPPADITYPEKLHQSKKKVFTVKPLEHRKDATPKTTTPKPQVDGKLLGQNLKEKQLQKALRSHKIDKKSQKPLEVKKVLPDHAESGLSAQLKDSPIPTVWMEEARAGGQLQAIPPGARERSREKHMLEPEGKAAPLLGKEDLGKQEPEGHLKAAEEMVEDQVPLRDLKAVPVDTQDVLDEKTAVPQFEEKGEATEDFTVPVEGQDGTQEPTPAPNEPFDNTTYKNLQHHDYSTYTFLDLNLNLSKFRMPQPSSGRESPRH